MSSVLDLNGLTGEQLDSVLTSFIEQNSERREFSDLKDCEKKSIWKGLFETIERNISDAVNEKCLISCRLLSRDRKGLNEAVEDAYIDLLMKTSGLRNVSDSPPRADRVKLESKQVLSNLIHQSSTVVAYCTKNLLLSDILGAIGAHKDVGEVEKLDLKLLFLLTALCPELRLEANSNLRALSVLNKALKRSIKGACDMDLAVYQKHLLQALFNLTLHTEQETPDLVEIAKTMKNVVEQNFENEKVKSIVIGNIINYLANMDGCEESMKALFLHDDMKNVQNILDFLLHRLQTLAEEEKVQLKEEIAPSLSVLWIMSKMIRDVRKYLKKTILPPLTKEDIQVKPEEGTSARNRIVALLTNPDQEISSMAAEFLFVLCKQRVDMLVKHSGYGNAAGLLARKGLLAGGSSDANVSSDEDSDTEEYKQESERINPITGRIEPERKNPMEGMSEEQKEYEAMKMVNVIDKLMRAGVIKPATIGEDGKPQAVEHVLQLQEGINLENPSSTNAED